MQEAMEEVKMVVEGVYAAKAGLALSRAFDCEMPIVEQVNRVLFENADPGEAVHGLMVRGRNSESEDSDWKA